MNLSLADFLSVFILFLFWKITLDKWHGYVFTATHSSVTKCWTHSTIFLVNYSVRGMGSTVEN